MHLRVAWSVLAFNHSMIFHSFPHVTSAVVHLSPMILSYGLRWHIAATLVESQMRRDVAHQSGLCNYIAGVQFR